MQLKKSYVIFILILILMGLPIKADAPTMVDWVAELPKPWLIEEQELTDILAKFQQQYPNYHKRLKAIALWRIGTPYQIFNLGEEQEPDPDPLFRLDVSDCTSHILTSLSLAESSNWDEARNRLIELHYKPDANGMSSPDYKRRWHYTSDRILNHPMTPELTSDYLGEVSYKTAEVTLNEKQDGSEFLALDWSLPVIVNYIPSDQISDQLLASLPEFIGVAFVKESYFKMGIITAHEGMLLEGKQILHAGQTAKETVLQDFMTYYFTEDGPKFDGIMLYSFVPAKG